VLVTLGLALAALGLAQWFLGVEYNDSDFGVREGVGFTSAGKGQLQGGLFCYPIAVILSFAALVSGHLRGDLPRLMTAVVLAGNVVCLILTYERTFWGAAVIGCVFVLARLKATARWRALVWAAPMLAALLVVLAAAAPGELQTAVERGASVSQAGSDSSLESRQKESAAVLKAITARPVHGSGFGAEFEWTDVGTDEPQTDNFVHNGYLWLSFKTGVPFMLLCVGLIVASIWRRPPAGTGGIIEVLRIAAQASLLGLLVINVTFPSFNWLSVGVVTGLLLALCWIPSRALQRERPQTV
jgi:O-antigen ligase